MPTPAASPQAPGTRQAQPGRQPLAKGAPAAPRGAKAAPGAAKPGPKAQGALKAQDAAKAQSAAKAQVAGQAPDAAKAQSALELQAASASAPLTPQPEAPAAEAPVALAMSDRLVLSPKAPSEEELRLAMASARALNGHPLAVRSQAPGFAQVRWEGRNPRGASDPLEALLVWTAQARASGKGEPQLDHEAYMALKAAPKAEQKAEAQVQAQRGWVSLQLAKWPAEQVAAYEAVAQAIAADPLASLAWQTLLLKGALPGDRPAVGGQSLLATLAQGATQAVGPGLDRDALLGDLIQELAEPNSIMQHHLGICTVTTLAIRTVLQRPAEYARVVLGLASPSGEVALQGGARLTRVQQSPFAGDPRSQSISLWADAMMDLGDGPDRYEPATGKHHPAEGEPYEGLHSPKVSELLTQLDGQAWAVRYRHSKLSPEAMWALLEQALVAGEALPVDFEWEESGLPPQDHGFDATYAKSPHETLVVDLKADGVRIFNPHGREEWMSREQFLARVIAIQAPEATWARFDRRTAAASTP